MRVQLKLGNYKILKIQVEESSEELGKKKHKYRNKEVKHMSAPTKRARELYDQVLGIDKMMISDFVYTDLSAILKHLDLPVTFSDLETLRSSQEDVLGTEKLLGFLFKKDGKYKIYIEKKESPERQRFTIAHEIGHHYLGHLERSDNDYRITREDEINKAQIIFDRKGKDSSCDEKDANMFASELLMPKPLVEYVYNLLFDVVKVATVFGVSTGMAKKRLMELGLIGYGQTERI